MFGFSARAISMIMTIGYLLTSISACAVQAGDAVNSPMLGVSLGRSGISVNILQCRPEIGYALQEAADRFVAEQDVPLQISIQTVADQWDYRSTLRAKLLSGEQVDLFHLTGASDADALLPHLEDLSDLAWVKLAAGGTAETVAIADGIYGVPYSVEATGLIANRDIFEAAGIPLGGIVDFDSMNDAFKELQARIDAGELADRFPNLTSVAEFAAQDTTYLSDVVADVVLTGAYESPQQAYYSPSLTLVEGGGAESFVSLLARYSSRGGGWAGLTTVPQNQMVENGLATQRVAVILQNAEVYRRVYAVNPDLEGRLALLPIPLENEESSSLYTGAPIYWGVNTASDDAAKTAAVAFLTWLYRSEEGVTLFAENFAAVSPYRDTAKSTGIGMHRELLNALDNGTTQPQLHREFPGNWGEEVFAGELQAYLSVPDRSWDEMIAACQTGWSAARTGLS